MPSLNQGAWVAGTTIYRFGHHSISRIPITGAPADTNLARWAMLHDGSAYRLYAFRGSTSDTLYQFSWDGSSYAFAHNSIPVLTLVGAPADVDASSLSMLHSGTAYHAYLRRLGDPTMLYQFIWAPGTTTYVWGRAPYLPSLPVTGFPADTDWSRWDMLHDGGVRGTPDGEVEAAMGNHCALTVDLDGQTWLVDCGLGDALHEPAALRGGPAWARSLPAQRLGRTQRELTTAEAWFAVLTVDFGLSLPELSRQERHALWSTARRAHDQWRAGALTPGEQ